MTQLDRRRALALGVLALGAGSLSAGAAGARSRSAPEADRKAILGMTGSFHVRFDTRETTPFVADYDPQNPSITQGDEVVRVIEDLGHTLRLQHILVARQGDEVFTIRHWRQDWTFEPQSVLTYVGADTWRLLPVAPEARRGRWAQTVWNTDDSPRYGAVGAWSHDLGVSRWTGERGLRPLARRDAVSKKPYTHYECVNRHALTPTGWVHEQDNAKIGPHAGAPAIYVHETVLNTYDRADDFDAASADAYIQATQAYWNGVRAVWDETIRRNDGLWLKEAAQTGSAAGPPLMALADQVAAGEVTLADAGQSARKIIADSTKPPSA